MAFVWLLILCLSIVLQLSTERWKLCCTGVQPAAFLSVCFYPVNPSRGALGFIVAHRWQTVCCGGGVGVALPGL